MILWCIKKNILKLALLLTSSLCLGTCLSQVAVGGAGPWSGKEPYLVNNMDPNHPNSNYINFRRHYLKTSFQKSKFKKSRNYDEINVVRPLLMVKPLEIDIPVLKKREAHPYSLLYFHFVPEEHFTKHKKTKQRISPLIWTTY